MFLFSLLRNIGKKTRERVYFSKENFCAKFWKNVNKMDVTYSTFGKKKIAKCYK
jgi:hypothetical protein